jgi:hypothetical protein
MSLADLAKAPADVGFGRRFYLVSYLPTYAAAVFVLVLVWAGAPDWLGRSGRGINFGRAWSTAARLGTGQIVMLAIALLLIAVVLQPFQLSVMRVLEGYWPGWCGGKRLLARQGKRRDALVRRARLPQLAAERTDKVIQEAGQAGYELRRRFPLAEDLLRPTALGNALAAMEDDAGQVYGLDAVVAWPRLYPVLGDGVRAIVDDRRDTMDAMARMAATMAVTTLATVALLAWSPWWWLALAPLALSVLAYRAAVATALGFGDAVRVAFDLHRFDLLSSLHMTIPDRQQQERELNEQWCDYWRQGVPLKRDLRYAIPKDGA